MNKVIAIERKKIIKSAYVNMHDLFHKINGGQEL